MNERVQVVLDLYVEVDVDEFNVEMDREEGSSIPWPDLRDEIVEQIEEAVKDSSNGSSVQFSFAEENTKVTKLK